MSSESFAGAAVRLAGAAAALLGWTPGEFWNATPAELAASLSAGTEVDAPDRMAIEALMQRFPDC